MNLSDTMFLALAIGAGTGMGLGASQKYGLVGFIVGFVGGIAFAFGLLGIVNILTPKKPRLSCRERNKLISEKEINTEPSN